MGKCPNCGNLLDGRAYLCGRCGQVVQTDAPDGAVCKRNCWVAFGLLVVVLALLTLVGEV